MAITSTVFVFFFLPISLIIYYLVGDTAKKCVLLVISLLFYACGSLQYLILFVLLTIANVCIGRVLSQIKTKSVLAKILLVFGVLLNVFILCYYKYTDFGLSIFGRIFNVEVTARNLVLPLGISFFTFKAISYLADIYNGKAELQENPVHDLLYLSFFAQVQSGPLSRYNEMNTLWVGIPYSGSIAFEYLSNGIYRFLIGFGKKLYYPMFCITSLLKFSQQILQMSLRDIFGSALFAILCSCFLILPDILIWQSASPRCLDMIVWRTLIIRI